MNGFRIAALGGAALAAMLAASCGQDQAPRTDATAADRLDGPVLVEGFSTPESMSHDPVADRYLVANVGAFGPENDGFISSLYPDGSVDELRFIEAGDGVDLANPLGTFVHDGSLYVVDSPYVRVFDLETREQTEAHFVEGAGFLNDLGIDTGDGTIFVSDMGGEEPDSWAIIQIAPDGTVSEFARGADLQRPNGVEVDGDGRVVLVAVAVPQLIVLSRDTGLVEQSIALPDGGYDGLVILDDGYVVSTPFGNAIYRIGLDGESTVIDDSIPMPASLGFDRTRNRLLVPQLMENTVTLIDLDFD